MEQLRQLQAKGNIRITGLDTPPAQNNIGGRIVTKTWKSKSEQKEWLSTNLLYWCNHQVLTLEEEYTFHPERKWRFDWAIPALKIAIEYEGGIFMAEGNKGHGSVGGILRDIEKYNEATVLGWRVIRVSPKDYKSVIQLINRMV